MKKIVKDGDKEKWVQFSMSASSPDTGNSIDLLDPDATMKAIGASPKYVPAVNSLVQGMVADEALLSMEQALKAAASNAVDAGKPFTKADFEKVAKEIMAGPLVGASPANMPPASWGAKEVLAMSTLDLSKPPTSELLAELQAAKNKPPIKFLDYQGLLKKMPGLKEANEAATKTYDEMKGIAKGFTLKLTEEAHAIKHYDAASNLVGNVVPIDPALIIEPPLSGLQTPDEIDHFIVGSLAKCGIKADPVCVLNPTMGHVILQVTVFLAEHQKPTFQAALLQIKQCLEYGLPLGTHYEFDVVTFPVPSAVASTYIPAAHDKQLVIKPIPMESEFSWGYGWAHHMKYGADYGNGVAGFLAEGELPAAVDLKPHQKPTSLEMTVHKTVSAEAYDKLVSNKAGPGGRSITFKNIGKMPGHQPEKVSDVVAKETIAGAQWLDKQIVKSIENASGEDLKKLAELTGMPVWTAKQKPLKHLDTVGPMAAQQELAEAAKKDAALAARKTHVIEFKGKIPAAALAEFKEKWFGMVQGQGLPLVEPQVKALTGAGQPVFLITISVPDNTKPGAWKSLKAHAKILDNWMGEHGIQTHTMIHTASASIEIQPLAEAPSFQKAFEKALHNYLNANNLALVTHEQLMSIPGPPPAPKMMTSALYPSMDPPCQACGSKEHGALQTGTFEIACPDVMVKAFAEFENKEK